MSKTTGILMYHDDHVLLAKRSPKAVMPNYWSVPGGHVELGESVEEAAIREVWEETKIQITSPLILIGDFKHPKVPGKTFRLFATELDEKKKAIIDEEHSDWGWFSYRALPGPTAPNVITAVNRLWN